MSAPATYSLGGKLSLWLALQTLAGLSAICVAVYIAIALGLQARQDQALDEKALQIGHLLVESGGDLTPQALRHRLDEVLVDHADMSLLLRRPDGTVFYEHAAMSGQQRLREKPIDQATVGALQLTLSGQLGLSTNTDDALLSRISAILLAASLVGTGLISAGAYFLVRHGLRPLRALAEQTQQMTADTLHLRLHLPDSPRDLVPLVAQFNSMLDRLERAYAQLESFNADVAHELLTPLATLIGSTEIALRRERSVAALRDTLGANLEDLQRLAGIVQDMLFLSQADRGAAARRGPPASLRGLVQKVASYYEAPLADADLTLEIRGDHFGSFDTLLVERALSNLLSNAARYADRGSAVRIDISATTEEVALQVTNHGDTIPPEHLPRLFHRFYRADMSRSGAAEHHGLGLAIVSAVAHMHRGTTFARSAGRQTSIGFAMRDATAPG